MSKSILELSNYVNLVCSVAIEKEGEYLMVEEAKEHVRGLWNFPSGKVHVGENLIEAIKREALEETGYEIGVTSICSIYHYAWDDEKGITLRFNFLGKLDNEEQKGDLAKDVFSIKWMTKDELVEIKAQKKTRFAGVDKMIDHVLANQSMPLELLYTTADPLS